MVDIVNITESKIQMHNIVNWSHNIFNSYVNRDKLMVSGFNFSFKLIHIFKLVKYLSHNRIVNLFLYSEILCRNSILRNIRVYGNSFIWNNFYYPAFVILYGNTVNTAVLNFIKYFGIKNCFRFGNYFSGHRVYDIFRKNSSAYTAFESKLFIKFMIPHGFFRAAHSQNREKHSKSARFSVKNGCFLMCWRSS